MPPNDANPDDALAVVSKPVRHDSARLHVSGTAAYIDDIREPQGTLHLAPGLSPATRGRIKTLDLAKVRAAPGVVAVLTAADIPGHNNTSHAFNDDPLIADGVVVFRGQVIFVVVAQTRDQARRAARLAHVEIEEETAILTIEDALAADAKVLPDYDFRVGDPAQAIAQAPNQLAGMLRIGGQEHFYLEGQAAFAMPGEAGEMLVHSSTQDPTLLQSVVAGVLAMPNAFVTVETRRMGGAFGGKESQASQTGALAALAAHVTGQPCKLRLDRDDDFIITGKRHDFRADWTVGFDETGRIAGYDVALNARCGCSVDLSPGVVDRAMFHAANAYHLPAANVVGRRLFTNTVSNTAFRGFGGPQGMLAIERAMDAIAHATGLDPLDVRKANLYRAGADVTPYGMRVEDPDVLAGLIDKLEASSAYRARREQIAAWNKANPIIKRGLALTPVQFGISFTLTHMNQAGALVHVYEDGSVHLNHGGTEMGQGLFTKVAQVVAEEFGIPLDWVRITATNTAKVPNASPTAASAGSDLNGMAAQVAAREIKSRMIALAAEHYRTPADQINFRDGLVIIGNETIPFPQLAKMCRQNRVQLSHAGFYKTPEIHWDRAARRGKPFLYFAYGAACSEVAIDILTGENRVTRVDILHDAGRSLNPALDIGQIEGGFVQGMGWLTTEELVFDAKGRLATHAPSTYKIPVASDVPADFRVALLEEPNRAATIYRSKAVGEPPLMLAISVYSAMLDALHSIAPGKQVSLDAPATPERILMAAEAMKSAQ